MIISYAARTLPTPIQRISTNQIFFGNGNKRMSAENYVYNRSVQNMDCPEIQM